MVKTKERRNNRGASDCVAEDLINDQWMAVFWTGIFFCFIDFFFFLFFLKKGCIILFGLGSQSAHDCHGDFNERIVFDM